MKELRRPTPEYAAWLRSQDASTADFEAWIARADRYEAALREIAASGEYEVVPCQVIAQRALDGEA